MDILQNFVFFLCDTIFSPFRLLKLKFGYIKERWQFKSPPQIWDFIIEIGRITSNLMGVHVFDHMKNNWFSATGGVLLIVYFILDIYTFQYYSLRGEFARGLECLHVVGVVMGVRKNPFFFHSNESEKKN